MTRFAAAHSATMFTQYRAPPARLRNITEWVEEVYANEWTPVVPKKQPGDADFVVVTDASAWGWGAVVLNQESGTLRHWAQRWGDWTGRNKSSWAESEGIARALQHFFPVGAKGKSITVLTDSEAAMGAFRKGRSSKYAVNRAVGRGHAAHSEGRDPPSAGRQAPVRVCTR
eukprot:PhM_4_TR11644/c3_g1_i4/m.68031